MIQQKIHPAVLPLTQSWALHNAKLHLLFLFLNSISLKNHRSQFHFVLLIINFKDKKNDFTRTPQKNYSFELSSVAPSLCTSLSCEIAPFLLTSTLPASPCSTSPKLLPFYQCFHIMLPEIFRFSGASLGCIQHFALLWRKCNSRRKKIGYGQEP